MELLQTKTSRVKFVPLSGAYATEMLRARPAYLPAIDEDQEEGDQKPEKQLTKTKISNPAQGVKVTSCRHPPVVSSARSRGSNWQDNNKAKTSSLDFNNQQGKSENIKVTATPLLPEDDRKMSETKRRLDMETITASPLANLQSRLEMSLPSSATQSHGFESLLQKAITIKKQRSVRKRKYKAISTDSKTPDSNGFGKILPSGETVWISHLPSRSSSYAFLRAPRPEDRIKRIPGRKTHHLWKINLPSTFEDTWSRYATVLSGVRMSHFGIETSAQTKPGMEPKQDPAPKVQQEPNAEANADADSESESESESESGVESELHPLATSDSDSESNAEEQTEDMVVSKPVSSTESTNKNPANPINVVCLFRIYRVANPIRAKPPPQKPAVQTKDKHRYVLNGGDSSIDEKLRLQHRAEVENNLKSADPLLNKAELTLLRHPYTISDLKYHHAVLPRAGGRTSTSPRQGQNGKMIWRGKARWRHPCPKLGRPTR